MNRESHYTGNFKNNLAYKSKPYFQSESSKNLALQVKIKFFKKNWQNNVYLYILYTLYCNLKIMNVTQNLHQGSDTVFPPTMHTLTSIQSLSELKDVLSKLISRVEAENPDFEFNDFNIDNILDSIKAAGKADDNDIRYLQDLENDWDKKTDWKIHYPPDWLNMYGEILFALWERIEYLTNLKETAKCVDSVLQ